jgi:hypothetical protein
MTEQEWLQAAYPQAMLKFLVGKTKRRKRDKARSRKLRLFAVACCYRVWKWMPDERSRIGIETAEKYADDLVGEDELEIAREGTGGACTTVWGMGWHIYQSARAAHFSLDHRVDVLVMAAQEVVGANGNYITDTLSCEPDSELVQKAMSQENAHQLGLLRDIFGNPFHPIAITSSWLTWHDGLLVSMAQKMYDSRDFSDMPVLADALEEAGCTNQDILVHCRSAGEHVRGCWVVDSLLGKS